MDELSSLSPRVFKAGRFRNSNVFAAALAGGLGGVLMLVVMGIVVSINPTRNNILFAGGLALVLVLSVLCFFPGNLIAAYPYEVLLEQGKGLELRAPLKKVYIPIGEIRDVRKSYLQSGYVVRLILRHGLLKGFVVHLFFGNQGELLANAIREEIRCQAV